MSKLMIALLVDWLTVTAALPWPWIVAAPPPTVPADASRVTRQGERKGLAAVRSTAAAGARPRCADRPAAAP